ncbi:phage tail fiber protein [Burkholderia stabilis]|uniref:phage tail fiber domain-containing protein n=1 Tax=Burkholderia stabilis TaxID=95485 RepID=UPI00158C4F3E|nr:phage tail fiber protein [Burkholderia stabilis]
MFYSRATYSGTGSVTPYAVTYPYLSKDHVEVRIDDVLTSAFTWINSSTVSLVAPTGSTVEVRRNTPKTPAAVTYYDGSTLTESDLNLETTQLLYSVQEAIDEASTKLGFLFPGSFNALGHRIVNLGAPQAAADAATKKYVDDTSAAGDATVRAYADAGDAATRAYADAKDQVTIDAAKRVAEQISSGASGAMGTFIQDGAGAVPRTFQSKMRETVSVTDYGAIGDGIADDTAAIKEAITYLASVGGGTLLFPRGVYKITSTIFITHDHITLQGEGGAVDGNVLYVGGMAAAIASASSRIVWGGGSSGLAISFQPAVDDGTLPAIIGGGLVDLMVDGNLSAGTGLKVLTMRYGVFRNSSVMRCTAVNTLVGTTVLNVVGGNKSTAFCSFENFTSSNATLGGNAKTLVCFGHVADGNVAINSFFNCGFYSGTGSGSHIEMENCDSNTFTHCRWNGSLTLHASDTGAFSQGDSVARHNVFVNPQGHIIAKGKVSADKVQGSSGFHSYGNMAMGYSRENGIAYPTIEPYADLQYHATGLGLVNNLGGVDVGKAPAICLMAKTANQAVPSDSTAVVEWDAVSYDWFSSGDAQANKINAPNGIKWARFIYGVEWGNNSTAGRFVGIRRNGVDIISKNQNSGYNNSQEVVSSQLFAITPGDYFEMVVSQNTGASLNLLGTTCTFLQAEWC